MTKLRDLTGKRFGRWTVISYFDKNKWGVHRWLCRCDCGNERVLTGISLNAGQTTSCGCYKREVHTKHGYLAKGVHSKLYSSWQCMKARCLNPNHKRYKRYGGRGISICETWLNFSCFKDWALSNGYEEGLTIERVDVNGDYCPENCTWITNEAQQTNTSRSIKYLGVCEAEWERRLGFQRGRIKTYRRNKKITLEEAVRHFKGVK